MGAPTPGSTFQPTPPQGGNPMQPQQPVQVPPQGGKGGVQPTQPQSPYTPYVDIGYPPQQPGQVPPQGGKGTSRQDYDRMMAQVSFAPGTTPPTYEEFVQNRLNPKPMPQVMPQKPGVPAQGGKAGTPPPGMPNSYPGMPLTPQQPGLNTVPYDRIDPNQTVPMPPPGTIAYNTYQQTGRLPTYGEISQPQSRPTNMAPRGNPMQPATMPTNMAPRGNPMQPATTRPANMAPQRPPNTFPGVIPLTPQGLAGLRGRR